MGQTNHNQTTDSRIFSPRSTSPEQAEVWMNHSFWWLIWIIQGINRHSNGLGKTTETHHGVHLQPMKPVWCVCLCNYYSIFDIYNFLLLYPPSMFSFCNAMFPLKRKVSHKIHKATIKNVLVFKKQKDVGSQRSAWSVSLHSSARQVVKFPYHRSGQTLRTLNYWNLEPPGNLAPKMWRGPPTSKTSKQSAYKFLVLSHKYWWHNGHACGSRILWMRFKNAALVWPSASARRSEFCSSASVWVFPEPARLQNSPRRNLMTTLLNRHPFTS